MYFRLIDYLLISTLPCSQYGRTAVLLAAVGGHLDLVKELVEQHRADLLHKSKVSSGIQLFHMCTCHLCGPSHSSTPVHISDVVQSDWWGHFLAYLYVHIFRYILEWSKHLHNALMKSIHH